MSEIGLRKITILEEKFLQKPRENVSPNKEQKASIFGGDLDPIAFFYRLNEIEFLMERKTVDKKKKTQV